MKVDRPTIKRGPGRPRKGESRPSTAPEPKRPSEPPSQPPLGALLAVPKDPTKNRGGRPLGSANQAPPQQVPDDMKEEAHAAVLAEERGILRNLAAAIIGVAPSLIYQWTSHGAVKVTSEGLVPISEVRRKTIEWHDKNAGKRAATDEGAIEAKIRGERAKASLAELELEERLGKVVSREAVQARLVDLFSMVKTRLTAMPDAYAAELAAKTDAQDVRAFLAKQIHSVLTILADEAEAGADASASDATTAAV